MYLKKCLLHSAVAALWNSLHSTAGHPSDPLIIIFHPKCGASCKLVCVCDLGDNVVHGRRILLPGSLLSSSLRVIVSRLCRGAAAMALPTLTPRFISRVRRS